MAKVIYEVHLEKRGDVQIKRYIPIKAVQMHKNFIIETLDGKIKGKAGDYIARTESGDTYIITQEVFNESYELIFEEEKENITMEKHKHTKIMNNWFSHFICKIWFNVSAIAFIPTRTIILSKKFSKKAKWMQNATIRHEIIHMTQADDDGTWTMIFRYAFSKKWRLKYEVEAYVENILVYVDNNYPSNSVIRWYARILSGRTYLHMVDIKTAENLLKEAYAATTQENRKSISLYLEDYL